MDSLRIHRSAISGRITRRRAMLAPFAALLVLSAVPAAGQQAATASPGEMAAKSMAAALRIPLADARGRIARQDHLGEIAALAARRSPETFGGAWIDHADGGALVLAYTRDPAGAVAALRTEVTGNAPLRPAHVDRSMADLLAVQQRLIADRELARAGKLSLRGIDGASYEFEVDVVRNAVVVRVPTLHPAAESLRARYGADITVEAGPLSLPATCTQSDCRYTLRSGLSITRSGAGCTSAFGASAGALIYTAAHCGTSLTTDWYHGGSTYGRVQSYAQYGTVDAATHSVGGSFYAGNMAFYSSSDPAWTVRSTGTYATMTVGTWICKTGVTTGYTCGSVTGTNHSPTYVPASSNFIKSSMCVQPGDSGGGVYESGLKADGIVSGYSGTACSVSGYYSIFGHIEFAQATLGSPVMTSDVAPAFTTINGARHNVATVTVEFSKPLLCSSVSTSDFTAQSRPLVGVGVGVSHTVTARSCTRDSQRTVTLTLSPAPLMLTTLDITLSGLVTDADGTSASYPTTRSALVAN